jgi:isochorismate hydrolase
MKEVYFTKDSIHTDSIELLNKINTLRKSKKLSFNITNSCLLILDMQKYFLKESSHAFIPSAPAIVQNLTSLIELFLKYKRPVFITQHLNTESDAQQMNKWWKQLISEDNKESKLISEIEAYCNSSHVYLIKKSQYDAFYKTNLEKILKKHNIKQTVITGVMTHLCCETTARSSFIRGFEVIFVIDGTATYSEEHHIASLLNLAHGFAEPMTTKELLKGGVSNE